MHPGGFMRCFAAFILLLSVVSGTVAQTTNNSLTDEQRKEIIRLADVYSANPGDASLDQQATAVAKLLITPEFPICADHLPWVEKKKYKYAHEISVAYYLGGVLTLFSILEPDPLCFITRLLCLLRRPRFGPIKLFSSRILAPNSTKWTTGS